LKDLKSLQIQFHSFSLDNSHTVTIYWLSTLFAPLPDPVQSTSENDEANALNQTKTDENLLAKVLFSFLFILQSAHTFGTLEQPFG
jgi:hypothetical protein